MHPPVSLHRCIHHCNTLDPRAWARWRHWRPLEPVRHTQQLLHSDLGCFFLLVSLLFVSLLAFALLTFAPGMTARLFAALAARAPPSSRPDNLHRTHLPLCHPLPHGTTPPRNPFFQEIQNHSGSDWHIPLWTADAEVCIQENGGVQAMSEGA
jgi:hypothetical protein